jgi:acyl-CoA hydrolase
MTRACLCLVLLYAFGLAVLPGRPGAQCDVRRQAPVPKLNLEYSTSFVVYPKDTNHHGTLFGGKALTEMDRCAGIAVRRFLYASKIKKAVTTGADSVRFLRAGKPGDLVVTTAKVTGTGEKFVNVDVTVQRELDGGGRETLAEAGFTFVAVDPETGKAAAHGLTLPRGH